MQQEDLISANEFCIHYNLELSFIHSLRDYGLIETVVVEDNLFFHSEQLEFLEKIIRLHYELDINLEGIQTIIHLLQRMEKMQEEIVHLTNSLKAHEPD
jgi:chaperone modulatory protein CbpM